MAVQFDRAEAATALSGIKPTGKSQAQLNTLHQILTGKPAPSKRYTPPTMKPRTLSQNYGQFFVPHSQRTTGLQDDGGGFLSSLGGLAGPALGLLGKPLSIVSSTAKEVIDFTQALGGVGDWSDVSLKQWANQIGGWDDYYTFGKLLHDEDWLQDSHLTQLTIPGVGWKWDVNASFLAAAPFDIALDPLAWITFGLGKTAQVANVLKNTGATRNLIAKIVSREAADAAEAAARAAGHSIDDATRAAFKETADILGDQVSKAAIGNTVADTRSLINRMLNTPAAQLADEAVGGLPANLGRWQPPSSLVEGGRFFNMGGRPLSVQIGDTAVREIQDIARASAKHIKSGRTSITSEELNTVAKAMQRLGVNQNILDAGQYAADRAARGLPEKVFKPLFDVGDDAARRMRTPRGMVKNQIGLKIPGTGPIARPVVNKLTRRIRDPRGWDEMTKPIGIALISGSNKLVDDAIRFLPQSMRKLVFGVMGTPFRKTGQLFGSEGSKVRDLIRTSNNPSTVMSAKAVVRSMARGNAMTRKAQAELTAEAAKFVDTSVSLVPDDLAGLSREQLGDLIFEALEYPATGRGNAKALKILGGSQELLDQARNFWRYMRERAHELAGMEFIAERPNYVPHQPTDEAMEIIGRNFDNPDSAYSGGSFTKSGFERGRGYIDEEEYQIALMDWARKNFADEFGEGGWDALADSKKRAITKAFRNSDNAPTDEFMHEKLLKPGSIDETTGEVVPGVAEQIAEIMRRNNLTHELFNQNAFTVLPQYVTALAKRIGDVHTEKLLINEGTLLASWTTSVDIPTVQMATAAATMRSYSRKVAHAKRNVGRAFMEANTGHIASDKMNVERFKYAEEVWHHAIDEYEAELEIFEELQALYMERVALYDGAVAQRLEIEERIFGVARQIQDLEDQALRQALADDETRRLAQLQQERQFLEQEITALELGQSQATGYQDGIFYGLWERATAAIGTKLFIEKALSRGFGDVDTAKRFADWYADQFQRKLDEWKLANPDIEAPPAGDPWGTAEGNVPKGLMDDPELIFDPEGKAITAVQGRAWMNQVATAVDEHHMGEWMMLQDVDQFLPKNEGVYNGASSAIFSGLEMIDGLASDYIGQLDQMVAKYTSLVGTRDLPPPIQRYKAPTQEQLNQATDLIISYNNATPEERIGLALRRNPNIFGAELSASNQLQMDLKEALRLHFAVYGGDNLISIKNVDDIDVLAGQYGQALKQRAGWLNDVIQESPIAQLEMSVPNPMVSQAEKMDLGTYASLLQFRDRMIDSVQNGSGLRMRLGVSLEEIESAGTLLSREDLAAYGIRVDGAGDPINVAGMNQSVARDGLKTTFYQYSDVLSTGRIYAVQTPVNPKGHRNAFHTAISSSIHRELGLSTDNIALEFADTGVPILMRELELIEPWSDVFYQGVAEGGVAGRTLTLDVNGDVRALSADRWRARQTLRAEPNAMVDTATGELLPSARIVRAVNSDVELMESLVFDLLTGNPNPYGRNMDNYRLTRYGAYSRSGFGGSFDDITPPPAEVVDPTPPPAAAPEIPDRPLTTEEVSELDVSKLDIKEELKPKKPTKQQRSFIKDIESLNASMDKLENRPGGYKAGDRIQRKGPGFVRWANAVAEAHPELAGQAGVDTSRSKGVIKRGRGRSERITVVFRQTIYVDKKGKEVVLSAEDAWKRLRKFTNDYLERLKKDPDATPRARDAERPPPSGLPLPEATQQRLDGLEGMTKLELQNILTERGINWGTKKTSKSQLIVKVLASEGVRPSDVAAEARGLVEEAVAKTPSLSRKARRAELEDKTVKQLRAIANRLAYAEGARAPSSKKNKTQWISYIIRREFRDAGEQAQPALSPEPVEKVPRKSLSAQEQAAADYRESLKGKGGETTSKRPPPPAAEAPANRAEIAAQRAERQQRKASEATQGARDVDISEAIRNRQEELPALFPEPGSPDYPGIDDINVFRSWITEYDQVFQDFAEDMGDAFGIWQGIRDAALRNADAFAGAESGTPLLPQKGWSGTAGETIDPLQQLGTFGPQENPMFPALWEAAENVRNFVKGNGFDNAPSPQAVSDAPIGGVIFDAPEPKIVDRTLEPLTYADDIEVPVRKKRNFKPVRDVEPPLKNERAVQRLQKIGDSLEEDGPLNDKIVRLMYEFDSQAVRMQIDKDTEWLVDTSEQSWRGIVSHFTTEIKAVQRIIRNLRSNIQPYDVVYKGKSMPADDALEQVFEPIMNSFDQMLKTIGNKKDYYANQILFGEMTDVAEITGKPSLLEQALEDARSITFATDEEAQIIAREIAEQATQPPASPIGEALELEGPPRKIGAEAAPVADAAPQITRKARREELGQLTRDELARYGRYLAQTAGESRPKNRKKGEWISYIIRREFREGAPEATPASAKKLPVPSKKKFFDMGKRGNLRAGTGVDLPGEPQAGPGIVFAERPELTILERGRINGFTEEDIATLYLHNEQAINILDFNGNKDWGGSARRQFGLEDLGPPKNKADLENRLDRAYKKYVEDFENAKDPITERTPREQLPTDEEIATRTGAAEGLSDREIEAYQQYKVKRAEMDAAGRGVPTAAAATPPQPAPAAPVTDAAPQITRKARRKELEQFPRNELREMGEELAARWGEPKPKGRKKPEWISYIIRREFREGEPLKPPAAVSKAAATQAEAAAENIKAAQARKVAEAATEDAVAAAENLDSTGRFKSLFDALGYVPSRQMQDILDSYGRSLKLNDIDLEEKIIAQIDRLLGIRGKYGSWQNFIAHHTGIGQADFLRSSDGIPLASMLEDRTRSMAELVGLPFHAANSDELLKAQAVRLLGPNAGEITEGMDRKNLLDLLRTETGGHGVETRATAQSPHIQQPGMFFGRVGGVGGVADVPWVDGSAANYTVAVDGYAPLGYPLTSTPGPMTLDPDEFGRYVMNVGGETPLRIYGVYPWMEAAANQRVRGMSPDTQTRAAGEVLSGSRRGDPMVRPEGTQYQAVLAQEAKGEVAKMIPPYLRGITTLGEIATDMLNRVDGNTFDDLLNFADPALTGRKYTVATRGLGRNHSAYTVNVDAYEALFRRGFVDRSKVPPAGGEKYSWVAVDGTGDVRDLTLKEIHKELWADPAVGNQWAQEWGVGHKFGTYGEPWTLASADSRVGALGSGFDPVRASVNSVRLAKVWERTPEIANKFKRPGMTRSVFEEIMLFIGWRDHYLWRGKHFQRPGGLGSLVQVTPTQMDDIDSLISKYLNATSATTNKNWAEAVMTAHEGAAENVLNVWRGIYNNYFITQARRQQKAGRGLPKQFLGQLMARGASPEEMREAFSSMETMSKALIRSDLAGFPEDSLISKAFEQFHLSLAADGYSGFAWANKTDNYALTPFVDDFNLGEAQGFRGWEGDPNPEQIGNFNAPRRVEAPLESYFVNVVPTNPLAIHANAQVGDLLRASPTGEWDQVTMGNMVDAERYMAFFNKQARHALENAPTSVKDSVQIPSLLETAIDKEREIAGSMFLIEQQMEQSIERLLALGRDDKFPQFVKHPDEYLISQGITEPELFPEMLESGWLSSSKERRDAAATVLEQARERITKFREARDIVQRLRTRIAGETPQGQPIRSVNDLAALQDSELAELKTYIEWVDSLDKSVRELAIQDTKEINLIIDLLGSEEYSTAKEILGTANDLMFTNRFGDPMIRDFATADVLDQNFRAGWRPVGVRSQGHPDVVEAMLAADTYRGKGGSRGFLKYYDKAHNVLKGYMIMSPGFIMRNMYGGMFMNWLAGVSPVRYSQFMKAYKRVIMEREVQVGRASQRDLDKLIRTQGNVPQEHLVYVRELNEAGAFGPGQAGMEFRDTRQPINVAGREVSFKKLNPFSSSNFALIGMRKVNVKAETILRGTIGFDRLANGATLTEAFDDIYKFHFDYDDLSKFEREGIKRLIPFYTWTRRAIPLVMEQYGVNPVPFHRYMQGMQAMEAEPGTRESQVLPEWLLRQGGVPTDIEAFGQGGVGSSLFFAPDLPMRTFYDVVNPMFKGDMTPEQRVGEGLSAAFSMVTPLVKAPLEAGFKRNIWKGYNFDGRYEYVPSAFTAIPGWMKMLEGMGFARRTPDGEWAMQDAHLHAMAQSMPPFSQARRLFPDETRYQERWLSTWASFVFGLGVRTNTEYEQQMEMRGRTYRKRDEIKAIRELERIDAGKR